MTTDMQIQKALDDLHTHYKKHSERIEESAFPLFKKALEAVPIWITTAQSPQSIPMLPDIFDILVIDEATQCTITNILPLVYRAKRLAVIGDPEQLPAIPNIGPAAEAGLPFGSAVHGQHISGHCTRGQYNSSWQNPPEAQAVGDLVRRLRQSPDGRSRSIGVVTPFRAQTEIIAKRLQELHLQQDNITVGTAHTYQGDERDIMIFSPVVARGIGGSSSIRRLMLNPISSCV